MTTAALLAAPMAANAVPVTVNAGDSVLWNFDLTSATPAPTYSTGQLETNMTDFDGSELGSSEAFSDLNGGGVGSSTSMAS